MIFFWILWAFCAAILLVLLYYFRDSVYTNPGGPPASFYRAAVIITACRLLHCREACGWSAMVFT
jgi:hypothetical protein